MKKYPHVLFLDVRTCYCSDELPRSQCIVRLKTILQEKGLTCTACAPFRAQTCHHRRHMVSQRTLTFPVYRCHPPTLSQDLRFKTALVIAFGSRLNQLCHLWSSCMEQTFMRGQHQILCLDKIWWGFIIITNFKVEGTFPEDNLVKCIEAILSSFMPGQDLIRSSFVAPGWHWQYFLVTLHFHLPYYFFDLFYFFSFVALGWRWQLNLLVTLHWRKTVVDVFFLRPGKWQCMM